jgi:hypothetical protein
LDIKGNFKETFQRLASLDISVQLLTQQLVSQLTVQRQQHQWELDRLILQQQQEVYQLRQQLAHAQVEQQALQAQLVAANWAKQELQVQLTQYQQCC